MAIPFALPREDESETQGQHLALLILELHAALQQVLRTRNSQHSSQNHRQQRRVADPNAPREHLMILRDSELMRQPLPDLVLSAVEQLPPMVPQVTVSAPTSPTQGVAFHFPDCIDEPEVTEQPRPVPTPSPRPRPRRRRFNSDPGNMKMEMTKKPTCDGACCCHRRPVITDGPWANVAANLRTIADDFRVSKNKDAELKRPSGSAMGHGFLGGASANIASDGLLSLIMPAPLRDTLWTTVALYLGWRIVSRLR